MLWQNYSRLNKEKELITVDKISSHSYKEAENEVIKVWVGQDYMTILPNAPLKSSSSIIYELNENGEKGKLIGQLQNWEGKAFEGINRDLKGIIIFDEIKGVEITKLEF